MRVAVALVAALGLGGCAITPPYVYDLMDAEDDVAVEEAVVEASDLLTNPRISGAVRQAAARTLGRLRSDDARALAALARGLEPGDDYVLRRQSAWALGELRSPAALEVLTRALRMPLDDETGAYVLEAVAKHYALMSRDEDTLVEVVEAMVYFAGNRTHDVPAIYDLLGARTRTVGVNVRVLENAIRRGADSSSPEDRAALYNACLELLTKLRASREEILAGPAAWAPRVDAAVSAARAAYDAEGEQTALLVLWYLGHLARDPELAAPAARILVGSDVQPGARPGRAPRPAARLVAAWSLTRMLVHALGPRQALLHDLLSKETDAEVLRLFGDLSNGSNAQDALQTVLQPKGAGGGS